MSAQAAEEPSLSPQTYKALQAAQERLEAGDAAQAIETLRKLADETAGETYAQAVVLQTLAHAHISREDYAKAIPYLERSIALGALPAEAQQRARYNLAQLYMAAERFDDAVTQLKTWFAAAQQPPAEAHVMLGSAYLQLKRYREAVEPLRAAIDMSADPKEGWYQALLGAYSELRQHEQCAELLQAMLRRFPANATYWRQLAGVQLQREKYADALAVLELAQLRGHLESERDLLNLAQLYAHQNAPYKAAALIEREIERGRIEPTAKNWEQAANAWFVAREPARAIAAMERAVERAPEAELGLRLVQLYLEHSAWDKAADRLRRILDDKRLPRETAGQAWLLLGITETRRAAAEAATAAFKEAARFDKTKGEATQWLSYLAERQR